MPLVTLLVQEQEEEGRPRTQACVLPGPLPYVLFRLRGSIE